MKSNRIAAWSLALSLLVAACAGVPSTEPPPTASDDGAQQVAATVPTTTTTTTTTVAEPEAAPSPFRLEPFAGNPVLERPADTGGAMLPEVRVVDGTFHMWFTQSPDWLSVPEAIYHAVSDDGVSWTVDEEPALTGDGDGFDAFAVAEARVLREDDGTWIMYYNALDAPRPGPGAAIGRATAAGPEGPWVREDDPIVTVGPEGSWDSGFVTPSSVVRTDDGRTLLYYSGGKDIMSEPAYAGLVIIDADGALTRLEEPVLGPEEGWNEWWGWEPVVFPFDDGFGAFYSGTTLEPRESIGWAWSPDGVTWTEASDNPLLEPGDPWSTMWVVAGSVVELPDGRRLLYYSGNSDPNLPIYSIGIAEVVPAG